MFGSLFGIASSAARLLLVPRSTAAYRVLDAMSTVLAGAVLSLGVGAVAVIVVDTGATGGVVTGVAAWLAP